MTSRPVATRRRQRGIALLITTLVLGLMAAIAVTAIEHSGEESTAGGRARASVRTLFAADAGIDLASRRLFGRQVDPIDFTLPNGVSVQSRARTQGSAQPLSSLGLGPPPEGYSINLGNGFGNEVFRVPITASSLAGGTVELESKLGRLSAAVGGY